MVKDYGLFRAVDDVSFEVHAGEIFGLLGPNGAGKTSLISVVVTLEKATSGQVWIEGQDIQQSPRWTKAVTGFVPQEIISHGYFTLQEILKFQAGYYGVFHSASRIKELIKTLGLWEHRHKNVRKLSGGMKRRLMIAKALLHNPRLLLLDEPTAGVDVELRYAIWEQVRNLKKQGVAILFTTHYLEEAEQLCDRVAIIDRGKIQSQGETKTLVRNLTCRHLTVVLKKPASFSHPFLVRQEGGRCFQFRLPYHQKVGDFLFQLGLNSQDMEDLSLREGTLEEAFKHVLKEDSPTGRVPASEQKQRGFSE